MTQYVVDMYSCLLNMRADVSSAKKDLCIGPAGLFYRQCFKMILLCGLTELKAQISWMEDVRVDFIPVHETLTSRL